MAGGGRWGERGRGGGKKRVMLIGVKENGKVAHGLDWESVWKVRRLCCQRPQ